MAWRNARDVGGLECKVYVGGLSAEASRSELENIFGRFGRLRNVWVARRPPGFAFVEFENPRDAEDAAKSLDGTRVCGAHVRVEMSHTPAGRPRGRGPPMGSRYSSSWDERHGNPRNSYYDRSPPRGGGRGRSRSRSRSPGGPKRFRSRSPSGPKRFRSRSPMQSNGNGRQESRTPPRNK